MSIKVLDAVKAYRFMTILNKVVIVTFCVVVGVVGIVFNIGMIGCFVIGNFAAYLALKYNTFFDEYTFNKFMWSMDEDEIILFIEILYPGEGLSLEDYK